MRFIFSIGLCVATTLLLSDVAWAEPHQHAKQAQPSQPVANAAQPKVATASATPITPRLPSLTAYRRFDADVPLTDWVKANNTVREIGGWRAYAKEAIRANAVANQPDESSPQPVKRGEKP